MKDFSQFVKEEITIKGNTGIPGEVNKNEPNMLSDIDRKGRESIRGADPRRLIPEILRLLEKSKSFTEGKEKELEELAEKAIRITYSGILDNVDLDIKLVKTGGEIAEFMEEECEECDEEKPPVQKPPVPSKDSELKKEVDKRKLANNIIQGEAKNTKHILHADMIKKGLKKIYGEQKSKEIFEVWDQMTKIADKLDWIIPIEQKAQMMEMAPEGMAGACSVEWPEAKEEKNEKTAEEILKDIEDGAGLEEKSEEIEELFSNGNPIIKARGIDFPMLLHETVKGIYELIAAAGFPKDEKLAKNVLLNTSSFSDEAEDFKYGPYLAAQLRDFVNKNPDVGKYPNIREFVFGKLIELPADEFLITMKGIYMETPESRKKVDDLIAGIIDDLDEYGKQMSDYESKEKLGEYEEPESARGDTSQTDVIGYAYGVPEAPKEEAPKEEDTKESEVDYSTWRQADIASEIDDALDAGDYDKVKMLTKYLKEGKEIYLREIERLDESFKFHTRRK